jgi:heptosyltransferase-2
MTHLIDVNPFDYHIVDFQLQALHLFGFSDFHRTGEIHMPDDLQTKIDHWSNLTSVTGESLNVAIHPGARKKTRQWRPERFGEIAQRLINKYSARIILIGGPGESNLVDKVEDHMGSKASIKTTSLSLLEMAALLKRCHLFLGNDTAPGHIAGAVKCSTITMFGPNFPHLWSPISPSGDVLFKNLPCCGCRHEEKLCIRPENNCMDMITVDDVWEKTENLLHRLFHLHT